MGIAPIRPYSLRLPQKPPRPETDSTQIDSSLFKQEREPTNGSKWVSLNEIFYMDGR